MDGPMRGSKGDQHALVVPLLFSAAMLRLLFCMTLIDIYIVTVGVIYIIVLEDSISTLNF